MSFALIAASVAISGPLVSYGLIAQDRPSTADYGELLGEITGKEDWVISGDPLIASYASRMVPPEVVNVAYRVYPDLTLDAIQSTVLWYDVAVVVVCYRLNDMDGLPEFLLANGYELLSPEYVGEGDEAVLDLFQEGVGPVSFYVRSDIVYRLGLPTA